VARYEAVMKLVQQGVSQREISQTLRIGRRTVRRWTRAGRFPERAHVNRRGSLDLYGNYLKHRFIEEGCHNAAKLWRELCEQGFRGSK